METDHCNLLWLSKVESHTQQLYRWSLELPSTSLVDTDMLSRAPLDATDDVIDEDEEWKAFQINTTDVVQRRASAKPFKVFGLEFGIGCDIMVTAYTPFQIVGGVR